MKINYQKESVKVFEHLAPRINEALQKENWNEAYEMAFVVGLTEDIKKELKRIIKKARGLEELNKEQPNNVKDLTMRIGKELNNSDNSDDSHNSHRSLFNNSAELNSAEFENAELPN